MRSVQNIQSVNTYIMYLDRNLKTIQEYLMHIDHKLKSVYCTTTIKSL